MIGDLLRLLNGTEVNWKHDAYGRALEHHVLTADEQIKPCFSSKASTMIESGEEPHIDLGKLVDRLDPGLERHANICVVHTSLPGHKDPLV